MERRGLDSDSSPLFTNTWQSANTNTNHSSQHPNLNNINTSKGILGNGSGSVSGSGSSRDEVRIYCAGCQTASLLRESYACTECICGICAACVEVLIGAGGEGVNSRGVRRCPKCATVGGKFKPFMLDIR